MSAEIQAEADLCFPFPYQNSQKSYTESTRAYIFFFFQKKASAVDLLSHRICGWAISSTDQSLSGCHLGDLDKAIGSRLAPFHPQAIIFGIYRQNNSRLGGGALLWVPSESFDNQKSRHWVKGAGP